MDPIITDGIYAIAIIIALGWKSIRIALTPDKTEVDETE